MHGLIHTGSIGPEAGRRKQADRARNHRCLVGEDVAEHVLGQQDVELRGTRDQLHGGVVDERVLEAHAGVVGRDALDRLAPQA